MICPKCFKQVDENSTFCEYCGQPIEHATENVFAEGSGAAKKKAKSQGLIALILGAIGLIGAWIMPLIGYALGGASLGLSIAATKNDSNCAIAKVGRVLAIITFVFAAINSLLGVLITLGVIKIG